MKKLSEVVELIGRAMEQNQRDRNTWFIDFSGHVNTLNITYYQCGWKREDIGSWGVKDSCKVYLTEDGIQEAYWFLKNRI